MAEKPDPIPDANKRPPAEPLVPDAPNDGFPVEKDVSTPPPGSDVASGQHKEKK